MLKALSHFMLISTAVLAADNSDEQSPLPSSPLKVKNTVLPVAGEPLNTKARGQAESLCLPEELIAYIATFARIGDGIHMSNTCKSWQNALEDQGVWQLYFTRLPGYNFWAWGNVEQKNFTKEESREIIKRLITPSLRTVNCKDFIIKGKLSANGKFAMGRIATQNKEDFGTIWNLEQDLFTTFPLPQEEGRGENFPQYISETGDIVIGRFRKGNWKNAYKWTLKEGIAYLEDIDVIQGCASNCANAMTSKGEIIVGSVDDLENYQAVQWINGKIQSLGTVNDERGSQAKVVSAKGEVIAGNLWYGQKNNRKAFRWTLENGMEALPLLKGGLYSHVKAISAAGNIIVGTAHTPLTDSEKAVRWIDTTIELLDTTNKGRSKATAVSTDGKVIGGTFFTGKYEQKGFLWTDQNKMQFLDDFFTFDPTFQPLQLKNIHLGPVKNIIAEGSIIVGTLYSTNTSLNCLYFAFIPREDILKSEGLKLQKSLK